MEGIEIGRLPEEEVLTIEAKEMGEVDAKARVQRARKASSVELTIIL